MAHSVGSQLDEVMQVHTTDGKDLFILHSEHLKYIKLQVSENRLGKQKIT